MPTDGTGVRNNRHVETPTWKFRVDPELKQSAGQTAADLGEDLSTVLRRAMRAYVADPHAFNAACSNLMREAGA